MVNIEYVQKSFMFSQHGSNSYAYELATCTDVNSCILLLSIICIHQGSVLIDGNSSQFIADLLWEITEGENDFRNTKDFTHQKSPMNYDL